MGTNKIPLKNIFLSIIIFWLILSSFITSVNVFMFFFRVLLNNDLIYEKRLRTWGQDESFDYVFLYEIKQIMNDSNLSINYFDSRVFDIGKTANLRRYFYPIEIIRLPLIEDNQTIYFKIHNNNSCWIVIDPFTPYSFNYGNNISYQWIINLTNPERIGYLALVN